VAIRPAITEDRLVSENASTIVPSFGRVGRHLGSVHLHEGVTSVLQSEPPASLRRADRYSFRPLRKRVCLEQRLLE